MHCVQVNLCHWMSSSNCEITTRLPFHSHFFFCTVTYVHACEYVCLVLAKPQNHTKKMCAHAHSSAFKYQHFRYLIKYPRNSSFIQAVVSIFINTFSLLHLETHGVRIDTIFGMLKFTFLANVFKHRCSFSLSLAFPSVPFNRVLPLICLNKSHQIPRCRSLFVQNIIITFICAMHVRLSTPIHTTEYVCVCVWCWKLTLHPTSIFIVIIYCNDVCIHFDYKTCDCVQFLCRVARNDKTLIWIL